MAIKNLWSLNVDELLVADRLKEKFSKVGYEVFFPLNSQMRDIDLILLNPKTMKSISIQIKGSRSYAYEREIKKFRKGCSAWITINKKSICKTKYNVDFFIFVLHILKDGQKKKYIEPEYIIIPRKDIQKIVHKKKLNMKNMYNFSIWVRDKEAFDFRESRSEKGSISLSKYLNKWSLIK